MRGNTLTFVFGAVFLVLVAVYVCFATFYHAPEVEVEVSPEPPAEVPVVPVINEPSCFPPYIESGGACCMDEDNDRVCDEVKIPLTVIVNCRECNDNNSCTQDVCFGDECRNYCMLNSNCDDNDPYTSHDTCLSVATGDCSCRGDPVECIRDSECNDLNACTEDRCVNNVCQHICRVGLSCDDRVPNTKDDSCVMKSGSCVCVGKEMVLHR
ncbi:hypothetical protein JW898_03390 [Candidatus Woesearchaeota archaeon]|nr:hypothetical protein [Candidatus Woesearchaeota archaeon]